MITASWKRIAIFMGVLVLWVGSTSPVRAQEKVNVTFITASDMDTMSPAERDGNIRGGVARLAAVVKAERAKGENVVFVYPGDVLSPSIMAGLDQGRHMIDLLNMTAPDLLVPGNHEYDFGPDVFIERMKEANFTKLGTNTRKDGKPIEGFKDTVMMEFQGVKIGFMGLTTETTAQTSQAGYIEFLPTVETAKKVSKQLKEEGADMIVAVVHLVTDVDFELLYTAGIDLVLSGHDHALHVFYDGTHALVESKEEAEYVVMTDVEFDVGESRGKRRVRWWPNFRIVDTADVQPDPHVKKRVEEYENQLSKELDIEIGMAEVEITTIKNAVRSQETVFGNLNADSMRQSVQADVAFSNGGGIRGNTVYDPQYQFTRRDIYGELPFGDVVVKLEVSGKTLLDALENSASVLPEGGGRFLQVSNLTFDVDTKKPEGNRVSNVKVGEEKLNMEKKYTLATNDFLHEGGDGYTMLEDAKVLIDKASGALLANTLIEYIIAAGKATGEIEGRINIK